jgi:hypothetical protein
MAHRVRAARHAPSTAGLPLIQEMSGIPAIAWPAWTAWPTLAPWHVALALAVAGLAAFVFSRVQVNRARDDFSNAFFYAPSQKERHRQRRRRWTDISRALLAATVLAGALTAWLYVINGQG